MSTAELKFQDPPARQYGGRSASRDWAAIAAELRRNPGRWALVAEGVSVGNSAGIRSGRNSAFRPIGAFEVTERTVPDTNRRMVDVYMRFVGGDE